MASRIVRTTLGLPADLIEAADRLVRKGGARSRNQLVAAALQRELELRQRAAVDASIADMASDVAYLEDIDRMMREFARADDESLMPRSKRR